MDFTLPEKLTDDFLNEQDWMPGPIEGFEICELGLVRRPLDLPARERPGYLHSPEMKGLAASRYRLGVQGSRNSVYMTPKVAMLGVFGRIENKSLSNAGYSREMKALVNEYNERRYGRETQRKSRDCGDENGEKKRKCTTCGRPTNNYRCDACWAKIKSQATGCDDPGCEYKILGKGN